LRTELLGRIRWCLPSKLCRLNRAHLAAAAVVELVQLRGRMLELLRREIASWAVAPEHASLFGSAARGDGDTSSDLDILDILVIRPTGRAEDDPTWGEQLVTSGQRVHAATGITSPGSTSPAPTCGAPHEPASPSSMTGGATRSNSPAPSCAACCRLVEAAETIVVTT
jgi:hypothetical protein